MTKRPSRIGAIEAGGTKIICAVGANVNELRRTELFTVPTTTPEETLPRVMTWLQERHREVPLDALGIASFGPVNLTTWSVEVTTPKKAWRGVSWRDATSAWLGELPVGFDTDTDAAVLAEWRWGAAQGCDPAVYVTVGTGIGGGLLVGSEPVHGLLHPEFGHMFVPRRDDDDFPGSCPIHGDCLEGLASGVAVRERWHTPTHDLPPEHPAWDLEAHYLAYAVINVVAVTSPQRVVLGGGITHVGGLLERVRDHVRDRLGGYVARDELTDHVDQYIVRPGLGDRSGLVGAYALAADLLNKAT